MSVKKELLFATTNQAKVSQVSGILRDLPITVTGLDKNNTLREVDETGTTPLENAVLKATAYAKALGRTVLSMDVGLYIDGLPNESQPGVHVRRIPGAVTRPSDQDVLNYYVALVRKLGSENASGRWDFGFCLAQPGGEHVETTIPSYRVFSATVSKIMEEGYPLESIQIDPESGKYVSEMTKDEQAKYWQRVMGKPLIEFITTHFLEK